MIVLLVLPITGASSSPDSDLSQPSVDDTGGEVGEADLRPLKAFILSDLKLPSEPMLSLGDFRALDLSGLDALVSAELEGLSGISMERAVSWSWPMVGMVTLLKQTHNMNTEHHKIF